MATIKKYNGSTWENATVRKYGTATETIQSGDTIYADGTAVTVSIKGNTVQNGTPTPSNPVEVNGVGVRTENLLSLADVSTQTINGIEFSVNAQKGTVTINGTAILNQDTVFNIPIDSTLIGDFYVSGCPDGGSMSTYDIYVWDVTSRARCRKWDGTTGMESVLNASQSEEIQLLQGHDNILRIRVRYGIQFDNLEFKPMIRIPTAPSAFEPYGYKIPISINNNTTNIYIGDNPLRKSLDGTAYDTLAADGTLTRRVDSDGSVLVTPVVSQITMPSFNTIDGANSITVDTTVQPSEFTATWTGWHNAEVKEWDGSDWQ